MAASAKGDTLMAKKDRLTEVSERIGTAMGKADKKARQFKKAGAVAKQELQAISKQIDGLKKQLQKTTKRLKKALS
jgi:predicted  nucleic acid-binding Zn-ribbon protein